MAEYIDRTLIEYDTESLETDSSQVFEVALKEDIEALPLANVIERSKIDKAIKEMQGYLTTEPSNNQWIDGINHAIEILKRNIGG